ncbi:hypothetical protein BSK66_27870 [Paenibacillus odorifer]|uniref:hypothetical protein n=1 Tax=Paenibacillus TaxID=44249 RepID=UPI0003E2BB59|nr:MULTISPECIES: hypothetical protein [Paenibacillus]ETT61817.1 hypothetical protein C171_11671 [Paenibacillus sp. FSL H8-237]OMD13776.1 hypothetical protein BJP47_24420 [Paenibacillus odorifer]OME49006.1 hypothetical protein BSK66_27870 [Paenibacillus odorifer]
MYQWLKKNIGWIGIVITLLIACFPRIFTYLGEILVKYLSVYWLQGLLVVIVVLLIIILAILSKKSKPAP